MATTKTKNETQTEAAPTASDTLRAARQAHTTAHAEHATAAAELAAAKGAEEAASTAEAFDAASSRVSSAAAAHSRAARLLAIATKALEAEERAAALAGYRERSGAVRGRYVRLRTLADELAKRVAAASEAHRALIAEATDVHAETFELRTLAATYGEPANLPPIDPHSFAFLAAQSMLYALRASITELPAPFCAPPSSHADMLRHATTPVSYDAYPAADQVRDILALDGTWDARATSIREAGALATATARAAALAQEAAAQAEWEEAEREAGHGADPDVVVGAVRRAQRGM